ncbi:MAG: protein kinase [Planctomycetaceae bacterium]
MRRNDLNASLTTSNTDCVSSQIHQHSTKLEDTDTRAAVSDSFIDIPQNLLAQLEAAGMEKTVPIDEANLLVEREPAADLINQRLGKYRLDSEISYGGMGIILKARDLELDRNVAVKLLRKVHKDKPSLVQLFIHEARITGRLQHPGIIPIYETGTALDDRPYFVMKLVQGRTLAELLSERSPSQDDLPRLLKIFEQVCQTLSYTHSRGVIHLDIKPSNIMVGEFGEVHLMDWGLARASTTLCELSNSADITSSSAIFSAAERLASQTAQADAAAGTIWGTPTYMSPEQARGQCTDVRSDVFGLGGILCEILTGHPPHQGRSLIDVCFRAAQGDMSFALKKLSECEADGVLLRLARSCLAPDVELRPANAGVVAKELTMYLESMLQRAETDLRRFFDLSLDLFCIAGLDGYFRRVNSNFARVLGYNEKSLLARPFLDFVHPDDRHDTIGVMEQLLRGQPVVQFQNRYQTEAGLWRRFEWTAKSIPDEGIIFAVARDVTEQLRIRE